MSRGHLDNTLHLVFVYGTLKRNMPFHTFMKGAKGKFVGMANTVEKYPLIVASQGKLPLLLRSPGNGKIVEGEVFEVDDDCMTALDKLERHPQFYQRQELSVQMITDEHDNLIETVEKKVIAYLLPGFKEHLLDLPTYHFWDPNREPEQRYGGILPTDLEEQETQFMQQLYSCVPEKLELGNK